MVAENIERRKSRRIKGDSVVQFRGKNFQIYSNITNICENGLFVNTYYILDKGELIDLTFDLPRAKKTIDVKGRVVRKTEENENEDTNLVGLGIMFENLTHDDRQALQSIITG